MSPDAISRRLRDQVLADAGQRCGYCHSSEEITGAPLEIDHLIPAASGGQSRRENLWAACRQCNGLKGKQIAALDPLTGQTTSLFNPRRDRWSDHFEWLEGGALVAGRTPVGRATVAALNLNRLLGGER